MQSAENIWFWAEEFDLSQLTYQQFLTFFFDRPVVGDKEQYELFRSGIDYFVALKPATVVSHLRAMCQDLDVLTKIYSAKQFEQGLWAVFGAGIECQGWLFDDSVELRLRIDCIESMYFPFQDVVPHIAGDVRQTASAYFMWWDLILHTEGPDTPYGSQTESARSGLDAIYQTLVKILAIGNWNCQLCALHGLGHLRHPGVEAAVQTYLDAHAGKLSAEDAEWVDRCRIGKIA